MFSQMLKNTGLSLERLQSFLAAHDAGSIAKAAPGNANRQNLISRQISELEEFFCVELTRRQGRGIIITDAGKRLAELVRQQFQDLEDFQSEQERSPKVFRIGAGTSTLEWLLAPATPAIAHALGGARLQLESHRSAALVEAVREGRLDFGIVRGNAIPKGGKREVIRRLSFHLCVPRKLLPRGATAADLQKPEQWQALPFAAGKDGGQLDQLIRRAISAAGVDFKPRYECGSILLVRTLVELGCCAAILPSIGLAGLRPETTVVTEFPPLKSAGRALVLHWNERHLRRRGVAPTAVQAIAAAVKASAEARERLPRGAGLTG